MSTLLVLLVSVLMACGVFLALSKEIFRMLMGLSVISMAVNLMVFLAGDHGLIPPIIPLGQEALEAGASSPLPQALVLTAIVIGFALLCFALILSVVMVKQQKNADISSYNQSEPLNPRAQTHEKPSIVESE